MKKLLIFGAAGIMVLLLASSCIFTFEEVGTGYIDIYNSSGSYYLVYVYIAPSSSSSWGNDQLGDNIIDYYDSYTFTVDADTYDVWVEDDTGWDAYLYDVDVSDGETVYLEFNGATLGYYK